MMKKLRVLQVVRLTHAWGMDLFKEISLAFAEDKYEITTVFLSNRPDYELYKGYKEYNGRLLFWGINRRRLFWRFIAVWKLINLFKHNSFDAVISHHYKPMVLVDLANRFFKIPKLFSVNHDTDNLRTPVRKIFVKNFLSKQWKFISVSEGVKKDLLSSNAGLSPDRIKTIYNAIDIRIVEAEQLSAEEARKELGIPDDRFVFGNIARLVHRKGQVFLINAFAQITREAPDARLVIIGVGNLAKDLNNISLKKGVADKVIIETDRATNPARFLKAFNVFVLPSLVEPFGIVLIEAMSAHLPIVAANVDGIPEVVGDSGFLVPAGDVSALAQALRKTYKLSKEELQTIGARSYQRLWENFSIEKYHKAFQEVVER